MPADTVFHGRLPTSIQFSNLMQPFDYPNKAMSAKAIAAKLKPVAAAAPWNCTDGVAETTGILLVVVALELDVMLAIAVVEVRGEKLLEDGEDEDWLVDVADTVRRDAGMVTFGSCETTQI